ncbi:MAG: AAA family ATPase, partial [Deltaproteobacteria bacterium]|nr:AAA family ATPase [Deltaproteobacteria bacterium]
MIDSSKNIFNGCHRLQYFLTCRLFQWASCSSRDHSTKYRVIVFDALHKYLHWRNFLKGFYDSYAGGRFNIVVTGSSRLDVYRKGADSL